MTDSKDLPRFRLVKRGMAWLKGDKLGARWVRLLRDGKLGPEYVFTKLDPNARPGTIIEVDYEEKDDGVTVYSSSATVVGQYGDAKERAAWWAEEQDIREMHREMRKQKKARKHDSMKELVEPIRTAYWLCPTPAQRAQFLTRLVYLIVK